MAGALLKEEMKLPFFVYLYSHKYLTMCSSMPLQLAGQIARAAAIFRIDEVVIQVQIPPERFAV